jgi:hypothetical protein
MRIATRIVADNRSSLRAVLCSTLAVSGFELCSWAFRAFGVAFSKADVRLQRVATHTHGRAHMLGWDVSQILQQHCISGFCSAACILRPILLLYGKLFGLGSAYRAYIVYVVVGWVCVLVYTVSVRKPTGFKVLPCNGICFCDSTVLLTGVMLKSFAAGY